MFEQATQPLSLEDVPIPDNRLNSSTLLPKKPLASKLGVSRMLRYLGRLLYVLESNWMSRWSLVDVVNELELSRTPVPQSRQAL